ncbi:MAG: hypothetical protein CSA22_00360 [Deltaproteobacteria bacterium]|nr:MAG: hypothetical protein CSA22_00360 [Deltaproteobacteria bacterium]
MKPLYVTFLLLTLVCLPAAGCNTRHAVEIKPVEVKPIHITIDVNIKVDRALDDFFDDLDAYEETVDPAEK